MPIRRREFSNKATGVTEFKFWDSNGNLVTDGETQTQPFGQSGFITDTVTPNWKSRMSNGEIINNHLYSWKTLRETSNGAFEYVHPDTSHWRFSGTDTLGTFGSPFVNPVLDATQGDASLVGIDNEFLRNSAAQKALGHIASPDTLVGVTVAELHKTIGMIIGTTGGLAKAISSLLTGSPKKAVLQALLGSAYKDTKRNKSAWSGLKDVSGKWLEVRYGWTPMLYDLEGTLSALNAIHYPRFTARGLSKASGDHVTTGSFPIDTGASSLDWEVTQSFDHSARAYALYTVDENWFRAHKLGALCTFQTAWELVPFSFVIDWFVDIGQWLQAIEPRAGIKILSTGVVLRTDYERVARVKSTSSGAGYQVVGLSGLQSRYINSSVTRTPGFPLGVYRPLIDVKINVKRAIDSIALLVRQASKVR